MFDIALRSSESVTAFTCSENGIISERTAASRTLYKEQTKPRTCCICLVSNLSIV